MAGASNAWSDSGGDAEVVGGEQHEAVGLQLVRIRMSQNRISATLERTGK